MPRTSTPASLAAKTARSRPEKSKARRVPSTSLHRKSKRTCRIPASRSRRKNVARSAAQVADAHDDGPAESPTTSASEGRAGGGALASPLAGGVVPDPGLAELSPPPLGVADAAGEGTGASSDPEHAAARARSAEARQSDGRMRARVART